MSKTFRLAARVTALIALAAAGPLGTADAGFPTTGGPTQTRTAPPEQGPFDLARLDARSQGDRAEVRYSLWSIQLSGVRVDALCRGTATSVFRREGETEISHIDVGGALRLRTDLSYRERPVGDVEVSFQPVHLPRQRNLLSEALTDARVALSLRW